MWKVSIILIALVAGSLGDVLEAHGLDEDRANCMETCKNLADLKISEVQFDDVNRICECIVVKKFPKGGKMPPKETLDTVIEAMNRPHSNMKVVINSNVHHSNMEMKELKKLQTAHKETEVMNRPQESKGNIGVVDLLEDPKKVMHIMNMNHADGSTHNMGTMNHPNTPTKGVEIMNGPQDSISKFEEMDLPKDQNNRFPNEVISHADGANHKFNTMNNRPQSLNNGMKVSNRPQSQNSKVNVMNRLENRNSEMEVTNESPMEVMRHVELFNNDMEAINRPQMPNNGMDSMKHPQSRLKNQNHKIQLMDNSHINNAEVPKKEMDHFQKPSNGMEAMHHPEEPMEVMKFKTQSGMKVMNNPQKSKTNMEDISNRSPNTNANLPENVENPQARLNLEVIRQMFDSPRDKRWIPSPNESNEPIVGAIRPLLPKLRAVKPAAHLRHHIVADPNVRKLHFDTLRRNAAVKHEVARNKAFARPIVAPDLRARVALNKARHSLARPAILGSTANGNVEFVNNNQRSRGGNMSFRSKSNFEEDDEEVPNRQNKSNKHVITQPREFMDD